MKKNSAVQHSTVDQCQYIPITFQGARKAPGPTSSRAAYILDLNLIGIGEQRFQADHPVQTLKDEDLCATVYGGSTRRTWAEVLDDEYIRYSV